MNSIDCSIIIPVYYNEGILKRTFNEIKKKVFEYRPELNYELIFVDDGSGDSSLKELMEIREANPEVKVIKFTRNFGQVHAIYAGYELAQGKCLINISADLQDPPELMNEMIRFFEEGTQIVIAQREGRDEGVFRRLTSRVFYYIMRKLSFKDMPIGGFDYVLIGKRVRDTMFKNYEANPFFQGRILWTGFSKKFISYRRQKREVGKSRWTFSKKLTFLIDSVLSYSFTPLRLISFAGLIVSLGAFLYAVLIIVMHYLKGTQIQGWAPLMIVILLLSGFQMLMIGIIGEYIWRTLAQVRNRSEYIIDKIYD